MAASWSSLLLLSGSLSRRFFFAFFFGHRCQHQQKTSGWLWVSLERDEMMRMCACTNGIPAFLHDFCFQNPQQQVFFRRLFSAYRMGKESLGTWCFIQGSERKRIVDVVTSTPQDSAVVYSWNATSRQCHQWDLDAFVYSLLIGGFEKPGDCDILHLSWLENPHFFTFETYLERVDGRCSASDSLGKPDAKVAQAFRM